MGNHTPEPHSCCAAFVDFNMDYKQDLYIVNDYGMHVTPNQVFQNDGLGALVPKTGNGPGMGLAVGDLNEDEVPERIGTRHGYLCQMDLGNGMMLVTNTIW